MLPSSCIYHEPAKLYRRNFEPTKWGRLLYTEDWTELNNESEVNRAVMTGGCQPRSLHNVTRAAEPRLVAGLNIPSALNALADVFEASASILELEDNWDGEGSPAYSKETWERAGKTLLSAALMIWTKEQKVIPSPSISSGPDGSIDVYWRLPSSKVLLNVPSSANDFPTYYARDHFGGSEFNGTIGNNDQETLFGLILQHLLAGKD